MLDNGWKMLFYIYKMTRTDECGELLILSWILQGTKLKWNVCRGEKTPSAGICIKISLTFCRTPHANVQECQLNLHTHTLRQHSISCTSAFKSNESKEIGGKSQKLVFVRMVGVTVSPPPAVHGIVLGQTWSNMVTVNAEMNTMALVILNRSYFDQDADCSWSLMGNVVPEG